MPEKLALDGGTRTVPDGMVKTWPPHDQRDRDAMMGIFDRDEFHGTNAPCTVELQERWAEYCGAKYCLATNSGTAAVHMGVASAGVLPGDEVIISAFGFWASAASIMHHIAIPVFADIDPRTYNLDPALIEEKITERTTAILSVDLHGMPGDLDAIAEIAKKHSLKVIHDSCQAHGAKYKDKRVGSFADTAGFSLNRNKNLTAGEGGLYTTNDEDCLACAQKMRQFGEHVKPGQPRDYNAHGLGWNYRSNEFISCFALSQLQRLDYNNSKRIEFAEFLNAGLAEIPGVAGPYEPQWAEPNYYIYVVEFRPQEAGLDCTVREMRETCVHALKAEGLPLGPRSTRLMPAQNVFQNKIGWGRGLPWSLNPDVEYEYRVEDYPRTLDYLDAHYYLHGCHPPNEMDLMELYLKAFCKVMDNLDRVMELARDRPPTNAAKGL